MRGPRLDGGSGARRQQSRRTAGAHGDAKDLGYGAFYPYKIACEILNEVVHFWGEVSYFQRTKSISSPDFKNG